MFFRRLRDGANEIARQTNEAYDSWRADDMETFVATMDQIVDDCETLLRQARNARQQVRNEIKL